MLSRTNELNLVGVFAELHKAMRQINPHLDMDKQEDRNKLDEKCVDFLANAVANNHLLRFEELWGENNG